MQIGSGIQFFLFFTDLGGYKWKNFKKDLFSSFTVALLAIPQSIAYAMLAGLPPISGIYAAVFGTIFCSGFCSSKYLVSGPTTAIAILIQFSVADIVDSQYGNDFTDENVLFILAHLVFIIGIIQMFAGFFNVRKILQFVSRPVILGYFTGVAVAIFINQLFPLLGISSLEGEHSVFFRGYYLISQIPFFSIASFTLGLFCLCVLLFFRRYLPRFPSAIVMIVLASLLTFIPFFSGISHISLDGIGKITPTFVFPFSDFNLFIEAFPAAAAIALLGIFEVFSVSRSFAAKSGENTQINQDMFALGISNLLLSFIQTAMPASGSASRTSLNFHNGAKTRFSAFLSGFFVFGGIWLAYPLINYIPFPALAALLIVTVIMIVDFREVKLSIKATRGDLLAFCLTFLSCFFFRLDIAFYIGIIISIFFYLKKAAEPHLVEYAFNQKGRLVIVSSKDNTSRMRIIGYAGELFFGVADFFQKALQTIAENPSVQVIVLRLNGVYHVDASICFALLRLSEYMKATNRYLVITGVTEEVLEVFKRASIYESIGEENFFLTDDEKPQLSTWLGCLRANELLTKSY